MQIGKALLNYHRNPPILLSDYIILADSVSLLLTRTSDGVQDVSFVQHSLTSRSLLQRLRKVNLDPEIEGHIGEQAV